MLQSLFNITVIDIIISSPQRGFQTLLTIFFIIIAVQHCYHWYQLIFDPMEVSKIIRKQDFQTNFMIIITVQHYYHWYYLIFKPSKSGGERVSNTIHNFLTIRKSCAAPNINRNSHLFSQFWYSGKSAAHTPRFDHKASLDVACLLTNSANNRQPRSLT